jgi:hypothetical protein
MKYILLLLPLLLTGCSALGLISSVVPDGGTDVNANAQIGAENTQQVVGQQNSSEINAESVVQNTIQDIPPWVMMLLILGWLLPSPQEIFSGMLYAIDRIAGRTK